MKRQNLLAIKESGSKMISYFGGAVTMLFFNSANFQWAALVALLWFAYLFLCSRKKPSRPFSSSALPSSPEGVPADSKQALVLPLAAGGAIFLEKHKEQIAALTLDELIQFAMDNEPRWNRLTHLRLLRLHLPVLEVVFLYGSSGSTERPGTCQETDEWAVFITKLLGRSCSEPGREFDVRIVEPSNLYRPLKQAPLFQHSYESGEKTGWDFFNLDVLLYLYEQIIKEASENWKIAEKSLAIDITSATVTTSLAGTFLSAPGSSSNNYINQNDPDNIRDYQWVFSGNSQ